MASEMGIIKQDITIKEPLAILTGDIGGTNTRLQLTQFKAGEFDVLAIEKYKNAEAKNFNDIIDSFFAKHPNIKLDRACFAFAGPILNNEVKLTNLPWHITQQSLCKLLNIPYVYLINDFEAIGYSLPLLKENDYSVLQNGKKHQGNVKAIIGAGTGLGFTLLQEINVYQNVTATEGGHLDFAPTDEEQQELLAYMKKKLHRVSNERIVSGIGLVNIYKFVRTRPEYKDLENPALNQCSLFSSNFAQDITDYARQHRDAIALKTLDIFVRCYGSITGNLALTTLPYAGIYIAGGIAPKLLPIMNDGRFLSAFLDKGRMSALLADIPIYIILNTKIALMGAAYYTVYSIKEKH